MQETKEETKREGKKERRLKNVPSLQHHDDRMLGERGRIKKNIYE